MKMDRLRIRRWILAALALLVLFVFIARLMQIQIIESDEIKSKLYNRQISTQTVPAARGEIVDRNGDPLVSNRMGYDVVIDYAFLPADQRNDVIAKLITYFEQLGEEWIDTLPISQTQPFDFISGYEKEVNRLKTFLEVQNYASVTDVMYRLTERFHLDDFSPSMARKIAGVRYEMEQRGFALNVPYTFAKDIDISSVLFIKEHGFELVGVEVVESAIRQYARTDVAPHILGTIGPIYKEEYPALKQKGYAMNDIVGKSGIELAFEEALRGQKGERQIFLEANGEVIEAMESQPPVPGNTVMLTIDPDMQLLAQQALEDQINHLRATAKPGEGREADAGAAVVLHVKTGEVLALATYPSYDLKTYQTDYASLASDTANAPLLNRALSGQYSPGSIFKPVVALGALNAGIVDESTRIFCNRRYDYYPGQHNFTCLSAHGNLNITDALAYSCNIYFYDSGRRLGIQGINQTASQLGLGQPTGIEVDEQLGHLSSPEIKQELSGEPWYEGDVLQTAIGQLLNKYTPLQLANYTATLANRGKRMKVTLIREIRDYSMKNVVKPFEPVVAETMDAKPEAFETVVQGMVAASQYGSARAQFSSYPIKVAAKTGTPQTSSFPNSTFISFAPAEDPEIAIAVVIEKGWHGYTGAPVARRLFDQYFGFETPASVPGVRPKETPDETSDEAISELDENSESTSDEENENSSSQSQ